MKSVEFWCGPECIHFWDTNIIAVPRKGDTFSWRGDTYMVVLVHWTHDRIAQIALEKGE